MVVLDCNHYTPFSGGSKGRETVLAGRETVTDVSEVIVRRLQHQLGRHRVQESPALLPSVTSFLTEAGVDAQLPFCVGQVVAHEACQINVFTRFTSGPIQLPTQPVCAAD
jgi:hypothetical protein